jgi:hypothetical protein
LGRVGDVVTRIRSARPRNRSSIPGRDKQCFSSPSHTFSGYRSLFCPSVKQAGRVADRPLTYSAERKYEWRETISPPVCLHSVYVQGQLYGFFSPDFHRSRIPIRRVYRTIRALALSCTGEGLSRVLHSITSANVLHPLRPKSILYDASRDLSCNHNHRGSVVDIPDSCLRCPKCYV